MFERVNRIVFDLDNTLVKHDFENECVIVAKELGLEGDMDFKTQLKGFFSQDMAAIRWEVVTEKRYIKFIEKHIPVLIKNGMTGKDFLEAMYYCEPGTLMAGADELLEYLYKKEYEIVALTNWFYDHQVNMLKKLGIINYFERIYSWDNYYPKPNRLAILRAINFADPCENLIVGDDPIGDISVAKRCGIRTIGFNIDYTKYPNNSKLQKADIVIKNLEEIKEYL